MVIEAFNGQLYVNILNQLYAMEEVPEREEKSRNFDVIEEPKNAKFIFLQCPTLGNMPPSKHTKQNKSTVPNAVLMLNYF